MRAAAATCFALAAFAWTPPYIDRVGLAALGMALLALSIGRYQPKPRRARFAKPKRPALLDRDGRVDESKVDPVESAMAAAGDALDAIDVERLERYLAARR